MKSVSRKLGVVSCLIALMLGLVLMQRKVPGLSIFSLFRTLSSIKEIERKLQTPEIYRLAATNLARYCQSKQSLGFSEELKTPEMPIPLPQLGSCYGVFRSNSVHVGYGGGHYHFGYKLRLDEEGSTVSSNRWDLFFYNDNYKDGPLYSFDLPSAARVSVDEFLGSALQEYDLRLRQTPQDLELHRSKIALLLQHRPKQAGYAISNMVGALPDHGWPRLTLALAEAGAGRYKQGQSGMLVFVESKPSFSSYLYLAYFYKTLGLHGEAANAVERAVTFPITNLDSDPNNARVRGYPLGVYLFENGHYSAVIKICDALLLVKDGDFQAPELSALRANAEVALSGGKASFKPATAGRLFDPYEEFPLQRLLNP